MNILFATLVDINSIEERGIYQDLVRELINLSHSVYIVSPAERRYKKATEFFPSGSGGILKVRIGNIQKTNFVEKGIATVLLEQQFLRAVRKRLLHVKFDLILYSTPPITLAKLVKYIKKRDDAVSYLLLKDIFPQNAIDLGLFSQNSLIHRAFRKKEREIYSISNHIGCMSRANADYLLSHDEFINPDKIHVNPNSITPRPLSDTVNRNAIREKYAIPIDAKVFIYGGNLGKPQCVSFIVECMKKHQDKDDSYFLICGDGTDAGILSDYIKEYSPRNVRLLKMLPKETYDDLLSACDIGLIFLDFRFTIPNFPSRLLSYMEQGLPVLACTDISTDIGKVITTGEFGWWCESNDPAEFTRVIDKICEYETDMLCEMGRHGRQYLEKNYLAEQSARIIVDSTAK